VKQAEVKVGGEYLTKVGDRLARVTVLREEVYARTSWRGEVTRALFRVRTADGRVLPKARTAAALRPLEVTP
jgi:hypothetical protein